MSSIINIVYANTPQQVRHNHCTKFYGFLHLFAVYFPKLFEYYFFQTNLIPWIAKVTDRWFTFSPTKRLSRYNPSHASSNQHRKGHSISVVCFELRHDHSTEWVYFVFSGLLLMELGPCFKPRFPLHKLP